MPLPFDQALATVLQQIPANPNQTPSSESLDDSFDRSRIKINQPAKMILRACADLDQFGERGKLSLRQAMRHQGHKD